MKLRNKYSLYIILLLVIVLIPMLFFALSSIRQTFNEEMERKAEILSKITTESALPGFLNKDFGYFIPIIDGMDQEKDIVFIGLSDAAGKPLFVRSNPLLDPVVLDQLQNTGVTDSDAPEFLEAGGEQFIRMRAPVLSLDESLGRVEILYSLKRINNRIGDFLVFFLMLATGITVVSVISAYWLSRRLADPLVRISMEVSEIGKGQLGRQIDFNSRDELNLLVESINRMSTDLKQYQEEAIQNSRLAAIGEFSVWIAHELKTPMISLKPYLQRPEDLESDPEFLKEFRMAVQGFHEKLNNFSSQIKAYTKDQTYDFERVGMTKIDEIINKVLKDLESELSQKRIEAVVEKVRTNGDLTFDLDALKLEQVISNLVLNAIDAINGQGRIGIYVSSTPRLSNGTEPTENDHEMGRLVSIAIEDNGIGMDSETLSKVFKKFFTTKPTGTGLGLSWCFRIVRGHRGTILVQSEKARGTTFEVIIPAAGAGMPVPEA